MSTKTKPKYCCVYGCKKHSGMNDVFLFSIPKKKFNIWAAKIPRKPDDILKEGRTYYVCNAHFSDDCCPKVDKMLINGEVTYKPRKRVLLVPGSVPTFFDNQTPIVDPLVNPLETMAVEESIDKDKTIEEVEIADDKTPLTDKVLNYEDLCTLDVNDWSTYKKQEGTHIVFYYLNNDFVSDKKIIVFKNLKHQVKIGYVDITIEGFTTPLKSSSEFYKLVEIVENMFVCPSATTLSTVKITKCMGFKTRFMKNYCSNCCYYYRLKRSNENRKRKRNQKKTS